MKNQILIDIPQYLQRANITLIIFFIYDPLRKIINPDMFIRSIEKLNSYKGKVRIVISN